MYACGKEMTFAIGDKVWLSTSNLKTSRPSKKLDCKRTGEYTVSKFIYKNAYKLVLPSTMRNHNVVHPSVLDRYTLLGRGQPPSAPHPMIMAETVECEVDRILDSRWRYQKLHYIVQWAGYNNISTSWEPAEHHKHARDLVDVFHRQRPDRPRE
jgi:hypothetical protein